MPLSDKTEDIMASLRVGDIGWGPLDHGFRSHLADRYGVSRQRISNIARSMGLTGETSKKRARRWKSRARVG